MQKTLTFPLFPASNRDPSSTFTTVIVYEDFETGKMAKKTCDFLSAQLGEECKVNIQMWKFDVLAITKLRELAAADAAAADMIIVASHGMDELPNEVKSWIELWLSERYHPLAIVALCDSVPEGVVNPVETYLAAVARRAGIQFFSQPGDLPGTPQTTTGLVVEQERSYTNKNTGSILAGALRQESAVSHWGINE